MTTTLNDDTSCKLISPTNARGGANFKGCGVTVMGKGLEGVAQKEEEGLSSEKGAQQLGHFPLLSDAQRQSNLGQLVQESHLSETGCRY